MKLEVHIDPALAEARVEVYAPARTPEVDALLDRLTAAEAPLVGFRDDGSARAGGRSSLLRRGQGCPGAERGGGLYCPGAAV